MQGPGLPGPLKKTMKFDIIISGFGGQGMMSLGKIISQAALMDGKQITGFPSYGAEMRGGTAHCFIKIADSAIASPFIDYPDIAIILNQPSLDKFKSRFKKGSLVILNSDLVNNEALNKNIKKISLPLNTIALDCGSIKVANIVVLGVLVSVLPNLLKEPSASKALKQFFNKKDIWEQNLKAYQAGKNIANKEGIRVEG